MISLDYVRKSRGLGFIRKGMKVQSTYNLRFGIVKGGNDSGNIDVLFDGIKKVQNYHPKWCMRYFDKKDNVIAEYGE